MPSPEISQITAELRHGIDMMFIAAIVLAVSGSIGGCLLGLWLGRHHEQKQWLEAGRSSVGFAIGVRIVDGFDWCILPRWREGKEWLNHLYTVPPQPDPVPLAPASAARFGRLDTVICHGQAGGFGIVLGTILSLDNERRVVVANSQGVLSIHMETDIELVPDVATPGA